MLDISYCQDVMNNIIQYYRLNYLEKQRTPDRILDNYLTKMKLTSFRPFELNKI